jgi:DNA-binding response OmpR family regulator
MIGKVKKTPSGKRLLLVEDDKDSYEALTSFLESLGHETMTALTVAEGLLRARENRFDLIILDNWFNEGSGVELCKRIREFDTRTPILFYSAAAYEKDVQEGLRAGAQWYIIKPNFDQFQEAVARTLSSGE